MDNKTTKFNLSKRSFIIALALLVFSYVAMGVTLIILSKNALREQIEQRMLDVANTAAVQLNGDEVETITAEDVGSEKYVRALTLLRSFQEKIQLDYIYLIRANEDGTFSFMIDPDKDDPGEYGEEIESTEALQHAVGGVADVDKVPYSDDWGRFYSAYSPIRDSNGKVAGIVGVDFNADWYDGALSSHKAVVTILGMFVLTVGIVFAFFSRTSVLQGENVRYRQELEETRLREQAQEEELGSAIHLAYTDPLTGVKNKLSYIEATERIEKGISDGTVTEFGVIVFDLNGLKTINDTLGHEEGDKYIKEGCGLICEIFCHSPVFRIGGDEFVVLLEGHDYKEREELLDRFDRQIDENLRKGAVVVSTGIDVFDPAQNMGYSHIFENADRRMYERKCFLKEVAAQ